MIANLLVQSVSDKTDVSGADFPVAVAALKAWQEKHGLHHWSIIHSDQSGYTLFCNDCYSVFAEKIQKGGDNNG